MSTPTPSSQSSKPSASQMDQLISMGQSNSEILAAILARIVVLEKVNETNPSLSVKTEKGYAGGVLFSELDLSLFKLSEVSSGMTKVMNSMDFKEAFHQGSQNKQKVVAKAKGQCRNDYTKWINSLISQHKFAQFHQCSDNRVNGLKNTLIVDTATKMQTALTKMLVTNVDVSAITRVNMINALKYT
jgi:hypothetical protein